MNKFRTYKEAVDQGYLSPLYIHPYIKNNVMNTTDQITIGRDPVLTYNITTAIIRRKIRENRRRERIARIKRVLIFWKSNINEQ
jgi:hypothetical protein